MLIAVVGADGAGAPAIARADAVTQWNANAANASVRRSRGRGRRSVGACTSRWCTAPIYDAVNAIDGGHEGYLLTPRVAQPFDSRTLPWRRRRYSVC